MPPGRPRSRLAPDICTARLDALRHPGESWASLADRLGTSPQYLLTARRIGVGEGIMARWEALVASPPPP
jgi:hypothetical protein